MTMHLRTAFFVFFCTIAIIAGTTYGAIGQSADDDGSSGQILLGTERTNEKSSPDTPEDADKAPAKVELRDSVSDDDVDDTSKPDASMAQAEDAAASDDKSAGSDDTGMAASDEKEPTDDADEPKQAEEKTTEPVEEEVAEEEPQKKDLLTIASWGGAYEKSQALAYFDPFSKETGIKIERQSHKGNLAALKRAGDDGAADWDVVDLSFEDAEKACNKGLLELIDPSALAPAEDGNSAKEDFHNTAIQPCGIASMAWSSVIVFDKRAFKKTEPASLADFFDVKKFPGKRALRKGAKYNFELALMADGVEPSAVYKTLQTDAGVEQALKKLETLRKHIVWWNSPDEALTLLKNKDAVMTTAYSGRTFFVIAGQSQPFGFIWDGQIYDTDMWAIPRSSRNKKDALKFISYATKPDRLAAQTKWFPYGPMRKSAVPLIGQHAEVGIDMAPFIPTAEQNFKNALPFDGIWWNRQEDRLEPRFATWLANPPKVVKKIKRKKIRKYKKKRFKKYRKKKKN